MNVIASPAKRPPFVRECDACGADQGTIERLESEVRRLRLIVVGCARNDMDAKHAARVELARLHEQIAIPRPVRD